MVEQVMTELGIRHLRDKICHYLQAERKRKVALAGALVMRPELLILDEPSRASIRGLGLNWSRSEQAEQKA